MSHPKHSAKSRHGCLKGLLIVVLLLILAAVGVFFAAKQMPARITQRTPEPVAEATTAPESGDDSQTSSEDSQPEADAEPIDWGVNTSLPDDEWINILLLGTDAGDPEQPGRTDTIIIASVNMLNGQLKLTSIMRDTYVPIAGHGSNKINSANWFGGIDLALKTVNEAFGMNITHYAMVDFSSFAYIVDALGGVELSVSEKEMKYVNQLMQDMRVLYPNIELEKNDLTEFGDSVHLDAMQTLAFSRIRKLDSDYQRTSRQRQVLNAILQKLRSVRDPATLYSLFEIGLSYTRTSLNAADIAQLAMKVITNGMEFEELRLPAEGSYTSERIKGMDVLNPNLAKNAKTLHTFIYGEAAE